MPAFLKCQIKKKSQITGIYKIQLTPNEIRRIFLNFKILDNYVFTCMLQNINGAIQFFFLYIVNYFWNENENIESVKRFSDVLIYINNIVIHKL